MTSRRKRTHPDLQLTKVREAAVKSTQILRQLLDEVSMGVTPTEIDKIADELCKQLGVRPAFRGVTGQQKDFPAALCISVNDAVLHGIPSDKAFVSGDLIKLDFGIVDDGYFTDHCVTVGLGDLVAEDKSLLAIGKLAVQTAVSQAIAGNHTGDLGYAMQTVAETAGYNVLKDYVGHGIGLSLWESPQIPAYGIPGTGEMLTEGMVLCIEAQIVAGEDDVYVDSDGWTIRTQDGKKGVMFEYMVIVGKQKPEILTNTMSWPTVVGEKR